MGAISLLFPRCLGALYLETDGGTLDRRTLMVPGRARENCSVLPARGPPHTHSGHGAPALPPAHETRP